VGVGADVVVVRTGRLLQASRCGASLAAAAPNLSVSSRRRRRNSQKTMLGDPAPRP